MKKSLEFKLPFFIILFILVIAFFLNIAYFGNFHKNLKPITDAEKQKAIEILNKTITTTGYQIKFGRVYAPNHNELIQIELLNGTLKKQYLVDIKTERVVKK